MRGGILLLKLHLAHEAGADEGIKAGITLAPAGLRVNGCVRFGTTELPLKTGLPQCEIIVKTA